MYPEKRLENIWDFIKLLCIYGCDNIDNILYTNREI